MTSPRRMAIREWTMLALAVVITIAAIVVGYYAPRVLAEQQQISRQQVAIAAQQTTLEQVQAAGVIRGYKLRAVGCRTLQAITKEPFKPGDDCLAPELRPYFTPGS